MDELKGYEWVVYANVHPDLYEDRWPRETNVPDIDDVIQAGIKALGCEDRFEFLESDFRDSGHF